VAVPVAVMVTGPPVTERTAYRKVPGSPAAGLQESRPRVIVLGRPHTMGIGMR